MNRGTLKSSYPPLNFAWSEKRLRGDIAQRVMRVVAQSRTLESLKAELSTLSCMLLAYTKNILPSEVWNSSRGDAVCEEIVRYTLTTGLACELAESVEIGEHASVDKAMVSIVQLFEVNRGGSFVYEDKLVAFRNRGCANVTNGSGDLPV